MRNAVSRLRSLLRSFIAVAGCSAGFSCLAADAPAGAATAGRPQVVPLSAPQLWQRAEFRVSGAPTAANNFDPEQIRLDATFTAPSGKVFVVPGFWFQDYTRTMVEGAEHLAPAGSPEWRIRFTPTEPGDHTLSLAIETAGAAAGAPVVTHFKVPAAAPRGQQGWVRNAADLRSFETSDGKRLRLIGENVCWAHARGTYDYDQWFAGMQRAGENFARLWFAPWMMRFEHAPGTLNRYDQPSAWQLDHIFELAEKNGIYLLIAFDHHGMFFVDDAGWGGSNNFWRSSNPYSAELGGPCAGPNDFFTDATARDLYRKRLRYLVARYGYSPRLLSWQFFNEIDNAYAPRGRLNGPDVVAWHREMGQWLRAHDPFQHLISTSLTGSSDRPEFWTLPEMDFAVYHSYGEPAPARWVASVADSFVQRYQKPAMIGEFGTSARDWNMPADPHLRGFRQGLWGGVLGGSVGTSMSWWWEDIHTDNAYPIYAAMKKILARAGWPEGAWTPIAGVGPGAPPADVGEAVANGEPFNAALVLNPNRRLALPGGIAVASPLAARRASELLSNYLHGSSNPQLQRPMRLAAQFAGDARLVLRVNSVAANAELVVRLDGTEALRAALADVDGKAVVSGELDKEFTVAIPAGRHELEISHNGSDWVYLDAVRLERVRPAAFAGGWEFAPEVVGLRDAGKAVLYVTSPEVVFPAGALRFNPAVRTGDTVRLREWPAGRFRAQWYDPLTGGRVGTTEATTGEGVLVVPVPAFSDDVVGVVGAAGASG